LLQIRFPSPGEERSFFERSDKGHLDLPRIREGGFVGGLFAVFAPANPHQDEQPKTATIVTPDGDEVSIAPAIDPAYAQSAIMAEVAALFRMQDQSDGQIKVVRTVDEIVTCLDQDILAVVLHFEGAEAIDPELDALYVFYEAGLRSLGIVWSRPNIFGQGVPFQFPYSPDTGPGLTDAGRELVRTCNALGIVVDVSHLNERGFWDVAQLSNAPLVATHSGAHALCPSPRNLTDKQLDAIGESNGVVGINFHVGFLNANGKSDPDTPMVEIVRHTDYVAQRIGIDHVAFGSDFDGATMPNELGDVTGLPRLLDAFRAYGYDDRSLQKIAHENWLRVLNQTWKAD
jgi:membrane dipeptidase